MDPQSLFFVLVVIAIGGYSAYLADILGYKIGKKRLSIKRIRPKYVARISVVIAGMMIPIITMLLLYSVSSTFRTWITRGSEIVRDLEQKSKEVDKINGQLVKGEEKYAQLSNDNKINEDRLIKTKKIADDQEKKAKELTGQVDLLKATIESSKSKISSLQQEKEKAQKELGPVKSQLNDIQKKLLSVQKNLDLATKANSNADKQYTETVRRYSLLSARNLELESKKIELEKKYGEITKASEDLQIKIDNLNLELESLKSKKSLAELETAKAQAELEREADLLRAARDDLNSVQLIFRSQAIAYLRGEEVTRLSILAKPSANEASAAYRSLLRRARSLAADHGAKADQTYPFSGSAGMILRDTNDRPLSEEEVETYWVDRIRKFGSESILIARAYQNRFVSEPVTLQIDILQNPIVFRKGEIVTESKIDGRMSEIEILNGIREFLRTFVNTKARQRNMIPVQSRDGLSYGEFTQDQLLNTVSKVKAVPRLARLVAVAKQDIRAGEPLDIDIEVR